MEWFFLYLYLSLLIYNNLFPGALLQDGRIDYGEFVAMMQKGNPCGVGRRTMRNSLNLSMRDAAGAH